MDRHSDKLFFRGKVRDRFLRNLPPGVAYLADKSTREPLGPDLEAYGARSSFPFAQRLGANMKFDAAQITRLARDTGFLADNLEKVPRLRELLIELHKHPFLKGKLVLKGGTALNLFYLGLARLSVDIDLNYIAHVGRDATLRERPDIIKAVEQVASSLGYKLQNGTDDYALREWYLCLASAGTGKGVLPLR